MGEALKLIVGGPGQIYAMAFGLVSLLLQVFIPYRRYVRILKWLTLALLAYVATAFVVHIPWSQVLAKALAPHLSWKPEYITTVVAASGEGQFETHQDRHLRRHGVFKFGCLLHYLDNGGHAQPARNHRYPDVGASGNGAASDCRRVCVHAV